MRKKVNLLILLLILSLVIIGCNVNNTNSMDFVNKAMEDLLIASEVASDIYLPTKGSNEVTITWTSSDENYVSPIGEVNRPTKSEGDKNVILTANFTHGDVRKSKQYIITVLALEEDDDKPIDPKPNDEPKKIYPDNVSSADYYKHTYEGPTVEFMKSWKIAGLYNQDGSIHDMPLENIVSNRINVLHYGAKSNDQSFDNTEAVKAAINAAKAGDEVYFPNGTYYFSTKAVASPYYAHISLKTGVNLTGESEEGVILVSMFSEKECLTLGNTTFILAANCHDVTVSNLTVTAIVADENMPNINDSKSNNPNGNKSAPKFGLVAHGNEERTYNIVFKNCTVEYFQYSGIRLHNVSECQILSCTIQKATDLGGGGAGYGIEIRGYGHERFEYIDTDFDCYYNVVSECNIIGPYIRHGIILSYMAHNNLIEKNVVTDSLDDAIDVHGQDEFLNVFAYNYCSGSRKGAGLALGNSGVSAMHDASGVGNLLYRNVSVNNFRGITIVYGTCYTICVENKISECNTPLNIDAESLHTIWIDNDIK